ncbi:hypothetical protein Micbo1qcDRAFT_179200 [Microdochium bolleyi]|uniref:Uncharacterized protein n=1 Tax=Microdochium bolleyi TaxID=196109 RepID=A0A136IQY7_9PEZI|nr:hypothetical protein Micbo1qcDRAFT_179200 [Microdochium bolleyi]
MNRPGATATKPTSDGTSNESSDLGSGWIKADSYTCRSAWRRPVRDQALAGLAFCGALNQEWFDNLQQGRQMIIIRCFADRVECYASNEGIVFQKAWVWSIIRRRCSTVLRTRLKRGRKINTGVHAAMLRELGVFLDLVVVAHDISRRGHRKRVLI